MTRGRPPLQATREAMAMAGNLGAVIGSAGLKGFPADLVIFCTFVTIVVRVRRSRSHISSIQDIAARYREDLLRLRAIPPTGVVLRELWVRSPNGSWQYFRILDDGIAEIRTRDIPAGSGPFIPAYPVPVPARDPGLTPAAPPGEGFTCPFFVYLHGTHSS